MSVDTTADQKIRKAKALISEAYKELLVFLDEDTWGHANYDDLYIERIHEIASELLKLKRKFEI